MSNNYEAPQNNPQMVSESISAYRYPTDDIIAPEVIRQDSAAWKNLR